MEWLGQDQLTFGARRREEWHTQPWRAIPHNLLFLGASSFWCRLPLPSTGELSLGRNTTTSPEHDRVTPIKDSLSFARETCRQGDMNARSYLTAMLILTTASLPACAPLTNPAMRPELSSTQAPNAGVLPSPVPDPVRTKRMVELGGTDRRAAEAALNAVLETRDDHFVPVLIEMLRAAQIGIPVEIDYSTMVMAIEDISGQSLGDNWPAWVEWYGTTDIEPPPGFTGWKGRLLSFIDPRFADFLNDESSSRIRVEEIVWGGVRVDAIPALDNPKMIIASDADYLLAEEPVFGVALNGHARAYPLRILDWHEMANDVVGGVPVSLAYCTLCGAAIAYDTRASDGSAYTFGSSGFLFRSNKLMYDRQTRTLWNQLTGEPVVGRLAASGIRLALLPVVLTSWKDWRDQHPDTLVLSPETGYERYYLPGAAYGDYFASGDTMFPVWQRSKQLGDKDRIYALRVDGTPKAYPLALLVEEGVVNDTVGGTNVVLVAARGRVTVNGSSIRAGSVTYDAGGEVRAFLSGAEMFSAGASADELLDARGGIWRVTEEGLLSPEGEVVAPRLSGHLAYWFGWFAFFPHTLVYGVPAEP